MITPLTQDEINRMPRLSQDQEFIDAMERIVCGYYESGFDISKVPIINDISALFSSAPLLDWDELGAFIE